MAPTGQTPNPTGSPTNCYIYSDTFNTICKDDTIICSEKCKVECNDVKTCQNTTINVTSFNALSKLI